MMRIAAFSDFHGMHDRLVLPTDCDLAIIAGDVLNDGYKHDWEKFLIWVKRVQSSGIFPEVVMIAGNHDQVLQTMEIEKIRDSLYPWSYLKNSAVRVENLTIWGSPHTPKIWADDPWAFVYDRDETAVRVWKDIPEDVDILVTHGPAYGTLDWVDPMYPAVGCIALADRLNSIRPKVHICGHIHESYGSAMNGNTRSYNVSICTARYAPTNPVTVFSL